MTIIPRNDRFGLKLWNPATRSYEWAGTFDTREQAERAANDAAVRAGKRTPCVSEWSRIWLSDYARPAPATRRLYREAIKRIVRDLGAVRMGEVDRQKARAHALQWPRGISMAARAMWADAKRDGVVLDNPWTDMRLPQSRGRRDIKALTESELYVLAQVARDVHGEYGPDARAIILTLGYVGLRPGELCALRLADLDLAHHEMTIARSLDGTGIEKLPKNNRIRTVTVPPMALDAIRHLPASLDGYVFHSYRGKRLNKGSLFYLWRPIRTAWQTRGGADLDLYDLRHAAATIARERGLDAATVAVQLGHTDGGALVLERYGHPSEERARERLKAAYATDYVRSAEQTHG